MVAIAKVVVLVLMLGFCPSRAKGSSLRPMRRKNAGRARPRSRMSPRERSPARAAIRWTRPLSSRGGWAGPAGPARRVAPASPALRVAPARPLGSPGTASGSGKNCGFKKWGCEEACQQTYLNAAGSSAKGATQRAKVRRGSCQKACNKKFACEAKPPKSP